MNSTNLAIISTLNLFIVLGWVKSFATLCYVLVMSKAVESSSCGLGSIMVVGVLTCCALLHSLCDLKAAQMNMQCSVIQELMLWVWTGLLCRGHNQKHFLCKRWRHSNQIVPKILLCWKNLDNQAMSGRLKNLDSKVVHQAIKANWWVAHWEYRISLASHSLVWFVSFIMLAKSSTAAELCLM